MRLLLLLSALLTALTGAMGGRASAVAAPVAASATATSPASASVTIPAALVHLAPRRMASAAVSSLPASWRLAPVAPLYAGRRRV